MHQIEYIFAKQIINKGFFVKIKINFSRSLNYGDLISLDCKLGEEWKSAVVFANSFIKEVLERNGIESGNLKFIVTEIDDNPVDTSHVIVLFGLIKLVFEFLAIPEEYHPQFDERKGVFLFPK